MNKTCAYHVVYVEKIKTRKDHTQHIVKSVITNIDIFMNGRDHLDDFQNTKHDDKKEQEKEKEEREKKDVFINQFEKRYIIGNDDNYIKKVCNCSLTVEHFYEDRNRSKKEINSLLKSLNKICDFCKKIYNGLCILLSNFNHAQRNYFKKDVHELFEKPRNILLNYQNKTIGYQPLTLQAFIRDIRPDLDHEKKEKLEMKKKLEEINKNRALRIMEYELQQKHEKESRVQRLKELENFYPTAEKYNKRKFR